LSNVNLVYEYPAGGGAPFAVGSGFVEPQAVTVDSAGDLFIAGEALPGPLIEVLRSQPPILAFVGTGADGTGASSPQSVQIQNIGNAALSLSGLSVSENFSLVPGSGTPADCTSSSSLAPGAACNLSISFTPQSTGQLTGTVTLSDNSLNNKSATQIIQLTGNFPLAQVSPASLAFGAVVSPGTKTLPLSITNIGGSTLTIASTSIDGPSYTVSGSTCDAGVPAGKSCTLQILFSVKQGDIDYHQDTLTITTNAPAAATVTVPMTGSGAGLAYFSDELNFGTISANSQESLPVTLFNQGVAAGETLKFSINGPSYTIPAATNGCSSVTLSSGGSGCQLMVLFKPVGPGYHHDHLTVTPSSGGALSITLLGTAD